MKKGEEKKNSLGHKKLKFIKTCRGKSFIQYLSPSNFFLKYTFSLMCIFPLGLIF